MKTQPALLITLSLLLGAESILAGGIGHRPNQYIGYHHDGSGVFRGCTPVSTWNEWDFKPVTVTDARGKEQKTEAPDKERRVNVVWKAPHYNWSNGGMIIAGGKLIGMADRGGFGFYADQPAEFAGALVYCHDPATGKLLWKTDLDHWDLVPNGAELRTLLLDYNKRQTEVYRAWSPLGSAMRARAGGGTFTEEMYQQLSKPVRALIPDLPADLASLKGTIFDNTGYEQLHFFGKILPKYFPDLAETRKKLQSVGYLIDPWAGKYDPLGISMQTPVSDGKHIYVHTSYGGIFCLDLTGKIVWKRWQGAGWERAAAIPSPVLSGDLLHIVGMEGKAKDKGKLRIAVNKADGKTVWTAPFRGSYQTGPVVLDLPIAGDPKNVLTVLVFQGDGSVLRAKDGKELLTGLPAAWNGRPIGVDGDIVVLNNKSADGGGGSSIKNDYDEGWAAVRLSAPSADAVKHEVLWQGKKMGWGNVVARDGVVFHHNRNLVESFDIRTGEQLGKADGTMATAHHFPILAGDYLFGLDMKGYCGVAQVSADGRNLKVLGNARLGDRIYGEKNGPTLDMKFSYGCQMFASGNRIFIRSMTDLYCLGDPNQPLRLSKEHQ